jgi:polyhydroxybutyrate depolymerase
MILILYMLLIISCNKDDFSSEIEKEFLKNQSINISGTTRNYHLYYPPNPTQAPIIFLLHGNGGSFDDIIGLGTVKAP